MDARSKERNELVNLENGSLWFFISPFFSSILSSCCIEWHGMGASRDAFI
jgi:hypothetical protein